ncbi:MAG TPA: 30S ribosomal protein S24e [Methanoregulaceae archaeon]|nr:MAG: 30S ribosomal protein S24e [Methanolinea sp.]HON81814.1 30S ribosomal protein S24e [Methanoregulaceae archaeon]HPD10844.1 30S ribosomal protein S24e [Methanoregulaceae archaeon]HRT15640.1 30S ribosomal protein S24e [Methanoregulaceae archaeon]HRU31521.1 30S ribosomal protein S24e [Methanoregulaceae archaeon]
MEFEVTRDSRNELLSRREVDFSLRFDGATPSRKQVAGKLAASLNVNEKLLVLDSLKTMFGKTELSGRARVYDTEEQKKKTERAFLMTRGVPKPREESA